MTTLRLSRWPAAALLLFAITTTAGAADKITLWPVFFYEATDDKTNLEVLGPFLTARRTPTRLHWRCLGLCGYSKDSEEGETVWDLLWPAWRIQRTDKGTVRYRFFPAFFGRDQYKRYLIVFPQLWWFGRSRDDYTFTLLPFFHQRKGTEINATGLLPWWVARRDDRRLVNLFPLLWMKKGDKLEWIVFVPLFFHAKRATVLFPFFWDIGATTLVLPFYGRGKSGNWTWEAILPPLYFHRAANGYSEYNFLWPMGIWSEDQAGMSFGVRPLYQYERRHDYVQHSLLQGLIARGRGAHRHLDRLMPLFNFDRGDDRRKIALLWPLYSEEKSSDALHRRFLTALPIGLLHDRPSHTCHVLNLFWQGRNKGRTMHGLYPLYSFERSPERSRFALIDPLVPLDNRLVELSELVSPLSRTTSLFEFYKDERTTRRRMPFNLFVLSDSTTGPLHLQLIVGTRRVFNYSRLGECEGHDYRRRRLAVLTFFWDVVNNATTGSVRSQGLWPLYTYKRGPGRRLNISLLDPLWFWGQATGEEEHVSVLLKIFDYRRKPNGESRFSFIWRAFRRDVRGDRVSFEMFPFLAWEKSPDRRSFSFGWRMFSYERRRGRPARLRLFFFPVKN